MNKELNVVFFPHSANHGLAGTNRLQNIIYYLKKNKSTTISNIALEDKTKLFTEKKNEIFLREYKEIYYGPSAFRFLKHIPQTFKYLSKFRKTGCMNILYFYGEVDIKNFFFVIWAKLLGYRIYIDVVEDLDAVISFKSFKNRLKYKSAVFFRKRLDIFANGFVVVSTHLDQKIKNLFKNRPVYFLPVTINKNLFVKKEDSGKNSLTTIFYSGSFNEKDGLVYLLKALNQVKASGKSFRLLLSGRGSENEMQTFWKDVASNHLLNYVEYLGFLSRSDYMDVLTCEADILCMTRTNSLYANAGFPFKLGEYLITGKPVIASKVGDVKKYITPNDAYLVEPENVDDIRNAIFNILDDPLKAHYKGLNGQTAALKYFDHDNYADSLEDFLRNRRDLN